MVGMEVAEFEPDEAIVIVARVAQSPVETGKGLLALVFLNLQDSDVPPGVADGTEAGRCKCRTIAEDRPVVISLSVASEGFDELDLALEACLVAQ